MAACAWFGAGVLVLIVLLVRDAPNAGAADPRPRGFLPAAAPRVLLAGLAGGMIYSAGLAFAMLWGVAFFQEALGLTLQRASVCASFYSWGIIAGLFVQGVVTSRFRRPVAVMMAGAFGTGVSVLVILYAAPTFWAASVAMLFCGFFSAAYATAFTLVPDAVPREHASVSLGIANMIVIAVGGLVLQPFIGMLAEWQGGGAPKANALVILAVAQAAAMVLLVFLREPRTNPTAAPPRAGVTDSGR